MTAVASRSYVGIGIILLTIVVGMVLAVIPLAQAIPPELGFIRPDWVVMILIYWVIALPHRVGMLSAWLTGIAMDILLGSLIGQHALSYVVVAYIAASLYQRLRMFSVWQQALVVFALLGLNQLINFWSQSIAGLSDWSWWYLLPALSGALMWPWVFLLLRGIRRKMRVT